MHVTYTKGQVAMMKVQLRAAEKGMVVLLPTTEARYDLVLDDGSRLYRGQVKYAGWERKAQGSVHLDLRKQTRNRGAARAYSKDEVDVLLVYIPQIEKVLWVGPEIFHDTKTVTFRFDRSKNGQTKRIRLASDFIW